MKTCLPWYGQVYYDGDEAELPDDVAQRYIDTDQAELIVPVVETAALRTQPARGRQDGRIQTTRKAT